MLETVVIPLLVSILYGLLKKYIPIVFNFMRKIVNISIKLNINVYITEKDTQSQAS